MRMNERVWWNGAITRRDLEFHFSSSTRHEESSRMMIEKRLDAFFYHTDVVMFTGVTCCEDLEGNFGRRLYI